MYSVLLSEARGFSDCGNWQNRTRTQRDQILNRWDLQIITQTLDKKVVPAVQLVIIITRKDTAQWSTVSSPGRSTSTQGSRAKKISTASVSDTNVKVATTRVEDGLSGHVRMHCSCPHVGEGDDSRDDVIDYRPPCQHECQRRSNQECQWWSDQGKFKNHQVEKAEDEKAVDVVCFFVL